jgi:hypothetical protein
MLLITAARAVATSQCRRNSVKSISGATTSQNGSQPSDASCVRSGGQIRHAKVPTASHTQRTSSSALARLAGFDKVGMAWLRRCDGCIFARRDLTH